MTTDGTRWRCSLAAAERGDATIGTAVPARRWMLVGHPGPWTSKAATTSPVLDVRPELVARLDAAGARLQLVRPHGRARDFSAPWPVILVDSTTGRVRQETWSEPEDLVRIAGAFEDLADVCTDPIVLVCCHAKKDVCCAVEGRVVAGVLDDVLPGMVWETTHLGGDRFAGNVTILPEGSQYGRLDGTSAPEVVLAHLDGTVDLERWRGRTTWTSAEQVAVHDVMSGEGVALGDIGPVTSRGLGSGTWEVEVATAGGGRYRREVVRTFSEPLRLTCGTDTKVMARWSVTPPARPAPPAVDVSEGCSPDR